MISHIIIIYNYLTASALSFSFSFFNYVFGRFYAYETKFTFFSTISKFN